MQGISLDSFERNALENIKLDLTEKYRSFNEGFKTALNPENGCYGLKEIDKGNGLVAQYFRKPDGYIRQDFLQDGVLTKIREKLDQNTWATTKFDDNGKTYMKEFSSRADGGRIRTHHTELMPDMEIVKKNFTAITDSLGRPVMNKIEDLKISQGRESLNVRRDDSYRQADERGHLIADIFGGPASKENIVPQLDEINRSKMKTLENWIRSLKESHPDAKIDYEMQCNYKGSDMRPSSFEPTVRIDGKIQILPEEFRKIYNDEKILAHEKAANSAGGLKGFAHDKIASAEKMVTDVMENVPTAGRKVSPFHKAGLDEGMEAATITFAVSTIENVEQFMFGDISAEEMVINITKDTGIAGVAGYAEGFVTEAVVTTMRGSASDMIRSLGNSGVPAMVISFGIESYDSVMAFAQGEIDGAELAYDLGGNASAVAGAAAGAEIGATVGSVVPVVGTTIGGVVGGMVGAAVATGAYETAVEAGMEGAEVLADKAKELATQTVELAREVIPDSAEDVKGAINTFLSENNMPFSI